MRVAATLKLTNAKVDGRAASCPPDRSRRRRKERQRRGPSPGLPAFCRVQLTLTPSPDSDIKTEVWMPVTRMERQVPAGRQRGVRRLDSVRRAGRRTEAWLRGGVDRHRAHRRGRGMGRRASGENHRLGLPLGASDRGRQQTGDHELLRHRAKAVVLHGLFGRRAHGVPGSAALPSRLRRDPRGRARIRPRQRSLRLHGEMAGDARDARKRHPNREVPGDSPCGSRCLRCAGWPEGRTDRDVLSCQFDPKVIECKAGTNNDSCLTTPQVQAARKLYAGAKHPKTGELIFPGLEPGSELQWTAVTGGSEPLDVGYDVFKVHPPAGSHMGSEDVRSRERLRPHSQAR